MGVLVRKGVSNARGIVVVTVLLALALLARAAEAAPVLSGRVTARNGTLLSDVQVQVEIRTLRTASPTDAQGQFQVDAATLFSAKELRDAGGLMLKFSKPGFLPVNKLVRPGAQLSVPPMVVPLDVVGSGPELADADRQALDAVKFSLAKDSSPLLLIPYTLSGVTTADPKNLNELLAANLQRVIITHLQASGAPAVTLKLLRVKEAADLDRMRGYGKYLNALGVISGYGAPDPAATGVRSIGVSSTFLVVPQSGASGAPVHVDDTIPADRLASPRLYQHLSKLWGRSTVLAVALNEFERVRAREDRKGDKGALKRIATYLKAERGNAGPGDEALVSEIRSLLEAVGKELAR